MDFFVIYTISDKPRRYSNDDTCPSISGFACHASFYTPMNIVYEVSLASRLSFIFFFIQTANPNTLLVFFSHRKLRLAVSFVENSQWCCYPYIFRELSCKGRILYKISMNSEESTFRLSFYSYENTRNTELKRNIKICTQRHISRWEIGRFYNVSDELYKLQTKRGGCIFICSDPW